MPEHDFDLKTPKLPELTESQAEEYGHHFSAACEIGDIEAEIARTKALPEPLPSERESKHRQLAELAAKLAALKAQTASEHSTAPRTGKRNDDLQAAANELAQKWKAEGRKVFSKRDIARALATGAEWSELSAPTIERIISVRW